MSSSTLHIIAMITMLVDHIGAVYFPGHIYLRCIGRMAFPIYAFLLTEGFKHTKNVHRYLMRLIFFALLSEIPFNLMVGGGMVDFTHQNVLWTFVIALICLMVLEKLKKEDLYFFVGTPFVLGIGYLLGNLLHVDYKGAGVLMVLIFYLFDSSNRFFLGVLLYLVNTKLMSGYRLPFFSTTLHIQTFALLSLIVIWLYSGQKGIKNKAFQYFCYAFYPLHMMILVIGMLF